MLKYFTGKTRTHVSLTGSSEDDLVVHGTPQRTCCEVVGPLKQTEIKDDKRGSQEKIYRKCKKMANLSIVLWSVSVTGRAYKSGGFIGLQVKALSLQERFVGIPRG